MNTSVRFPVGIPGSVLGVVLAGGEGKRLWPLTADRAKPAVPFGGNYRLIDFVLSNLVNGGVHKIAVLTQYKSHSLDRHISTAWRLASLTGGYVTPVPAQQRRGPHWYLGSADAIYQSMNLIRDEQPDIVAVFGADNVYRMDPSQMIDQHLESGARARIDARTKDEQFVLRDERKVALPRSPKERLAPLLPIGRALVAPVGLRYHALHHWIPSLPYHNLGRAHRLLVSVLSPDAPYGATIEHGFTPALRDLVHRAGSRSRGGRGARTDPRSARPSGSDRCRIVPAASHSND